MPNITINGIQIEYETFGNPSDRPLLLVWGIWGQMIMWDEGLCRDLASRGHYVIRYDNRDVGLSSKFDKGGITDIMGIMGKILSGDKSSVPYTIEDMADDGAGLLDALGIPCAHICGISMGGIIAQTIALRHPSQVLSLTSIFSTTSNPKLPQPKPEILSAFFTPLPADRSAFIEGTVGKFKMVVGSRFPFDEEWFRGKVAASYDRCFYQQGMGRHVLALLAQNDRKEALASIKVPALVIHGTEDPLFSVEAGKETAAVIPGAQLLLLEGVGHDVVTYGGAWPQIVEAITAHTLKATNNK
ncbi:MAG: alpha/beta hydrolase [Deltaproteobacteria bacterium HGW-Deltaproteobacteria-13]|jgi:pimeloyl-ACP methyl ester carboxylesterase|nr:MAG: alpha/beta hydrolase [Deltaproteobacteria bacterium HGW-Deltaproteobacteria-13]